MRPLDEALRLARLAVRAIAKKIVAKPADCDFGSKGNRRSLRDGAERLFAEQKTLASRSPRSAGRRQTTPATDGSKPRRSPPSTISGGRENGPTGRAARRQPERVQGHNLPRQRVPGEDGSPRANFASLRYLACNPARNRRRERAPPKAQRRGVGRRCPRAPCPGVAFSPASPAHGMRPADNIAKNHASPPAKASWRAACRSARITARRSRACICSAMNCAAIRRNS